MHAALMLIFDKEFVDACVNGFIVKCADGVTRRIFLWIATYSADYIEKYSTVCQSIIRYSLQFRALLASIKQLGEHPCNRCTILKSQIRELGSVNDMKNREKSKREDTEHRQSNIDLTRQWIFQDGLPVNGRAIDRLIGDDYLMVPNFVRKPGFILMSMKLSFQQNAFSRRLAEHGFDFYNMLVPDLLHEVKLGVWKSIFSHLIRMLFVVGKNSAALLNSRQVNPTSCIPV